jgi:hypothetical protein
MLRKLVSGESAGRKLMKNPRPDLRLTSSSSRVPTQTVLFRMRRQNTEGPEQIKGRVLIFDGGRK